jgi:hypothetical protein
MPTPGEGAGKEMVKPWYGPPSGCNDTFRMVGATQPKGLGMIWAIAAVVYVVLFFWLGIATLRNGHGWLFFFGIFLPIFWIFGAFARRPATQ